MLSVSSAAVCSAWPLSRTLIHRWRLPLRARYAVMLAAAFAVFIPFGDLPAAAYLCAAPPGT